MEAHDFVWQALLNAPKPITYDEALRIGLEATSQTKESPEDFSKWFKSNGDALVIKLNKG